MRRRQSYRGTSVGKPAEQGGLLPIEDYLGYVDSDAWHADGKCETGSQNVWYYDDMPCSALILGYPHPDEPLSQLAMPDILRFARDCRKVTESGTFGVMSANRWIIVPVWDYPLAVANEDWWSHGEPTLRDMVEGSVRAGSAQQVEWDFPLETEGYSHEMKLLSTMMIELAMRKFSPDLLVSLHNSRIGEAYAYVGGGVAPDDAAAAVSSALIEAGFAVRETLPVPYVSKMAPGVFSLPTAKKEIEWLCRMTPNGTDPLEGYGNGAASFEFAGDDCLSVVLELPMFLPVDGWDEDLPTSKQVSDKIRLVWWHLCRVLDWVFAGRNVQRESDDEAFDLPHPLHLSRALGWFDYAEELIAERKDLSDAQLPGVMLLSPHEFWRRRMTDNIIIRECTKQIAKATPQEAYISYASVMLSLLSQLSHLRRASGIPPVEENLAPVVDDISTRFAMVDERMVHAAVSAMLGPITDIAAEGRQERMANSGILGK